jgi:DNA-binding MarR family transcriptional regulator
MSDRASAPTAATGDRLGVHVKRTEQLLIAVKTKALKPFDLTVPQYAALSTIAANPGASSAQVARSCLVTPQTIGAVLTTLADRGLIDRRPSAVHSGVLVSTPTRAGKHLAAQADRATLAIESTFDDQFGPRQRAAFVAGLGRIQDVLKNYLGQPSPDARKTT